LRDWARGGATLYFKRERRIHRRELRESRCMHVRKCAYRVVHRAIHKDTALAHQCDERFVCHHFACRLKWNLKRRKRAAFKKPHDRKSFSRDRIGL
jgi:hypothetical protein